LHTVEFYVSENDWGWSVGEAGEFELLYHVTLIVGTRKTNRIDGK